MLRQSFQQCPTIDAQLRLLEVFEGISSRELVQVIYLNFLVFNAPNTCSGKSAFIHYIRIAGFKISQMLLYNRLRYSTHALSKH